MAEEGFTFPVLLDTKASVSDKFGITGHPESFLIDRSGRIAAVAIGPRDWGSPMALTFVKSLIREQ